MSWSLLWVIPVLVVLVVAHEFGHFIVARWCGVRVKEFAFGFPPRLFARQVGDTVYAVNAIPLGGYVRLEGEDGESQASDSFAVKPPLQRAAILVAGATMNLLLVPVLLGLATLVGEPVMHGVEIQKVQAGSPAAAAHLAPGDVIFAVNGKEILNDTSISAAITQHPTAAVDLTVWPHGDQAATRAVPVTPRENPPVGQGKLGIAFTPHMVTVRHAIWEAPVLGVQRTGEIAGLMVSSTRQAFASRMPIQDQVVGPPGIAKMTGRAAEAGAGYLLTLMAILSLNLAIVNLLPFPALDGGRLAVVFVERLRGKRLNPRVEGVFHMIGFVLLMTLMVFISIRDVTR